MFSLNISYEQRLGELPDENWLYHDSTARLGSTVPHKGLRESSIEEFSRKTQRHGQESLMPVARSRAWFELGPGFHYDPLDSGTRSMRLVEILPTSSSDTIEVDLVHFTLETCPPFVAVSYTWDHGGSNYKVKCQGKELWVERNLWHFLANCGKRVCSARRFLWIDAICIDQGNVKERNHQVGQMQDIYSKAESVLVWLGEPQNKEMAALAFGLLHDIDKLVNIYKDDLTDIRLHRSVKQWQALLQVVQIPYWERIWIIQEIILPKVVTIRCGQFEADLDDFRRLCECLEMQTRRHHSSHVSNKILSTHAWVLTQHRTVWWSGETAGRSSFKLPQLLQAYKSAQSTDIRDKIYGLLGLAQDVRTDLPRIIPDYNKPPEAIFMDVVRNQCRWHSIGAHKRSHEFIAILRETLQIQSEDVCTTVLEDPDLRPYAHIILGKAKLFSPMLCIGTVAELHDRSGAKIPSKGVARFGFRSKQQFSTYKQSLPDATIDACLRHLESERQQLALKYIPDEGSRAVTRSPLVGRCHNVHSDWSMFEDSLGAIRDQGTRGWKLNESHDQRYAFVTTNNLVGYTLPGGEPGDLLCVLDDSQDCDTGLIMRKELDANNSITYRPVGPAIFQQAADVPGTAHRNERNDTADLQTGASAMRPGIMQLCYRFSTPHLAELLYAGFISVDCLPRYTANKDLETGYYNEGPFRKWYLDRYNIDEDSDDEEMAFEEDLINLRHFDDFAQLPALAKRNSALNSSANICLTCLPSR